MKISEAENELQKRLKSLGSPKESFSVKEGFDAMIAFYRDERFPECDLDSDGDMLLFQWGTYDWAKTGKPSFEIDLTRQFLPTAKVDDDDEIRQLSLEFSFAPDAVLSGLGSGNQWCGSPSDLTGFAKFIHDSPVMRAVASRNDGSVSVKIFNAG